MNAAEQVTSSVSTKTVLATLLVVAIGYLVYSGKIYDLKKYVLDMFPTQPTQKASVAAIPSVAKIPAKATGNNVSNATSPPTSAENKISSDKRKGDQSYVRSVLSSR
tara:strand:- start:204 stop:524 length:321 start_codon:yes stop_codon:yes gene_type:complete